jgi:hypothetical protein
MAQSIEENKGVCGETKDIVFSKNKKFSAIKKDKIIYLYEGSKKLWYMKREDFTGVFFFDRSETRLFIQCTTYVSNYYIIVDVKDFKITHLFNHYTDFCFAEPDEGSEGDSICWTRDGYLSSQNLNNMTITANIIITEKRYFFACTKYNCIFSFQKDNYCIYKFVKSEKPILRLIYKENINTKINEIKKVRFLNDSLYISGTDRQYKICCSFLDKRNIIFTALQSLINNKTKWDCNYLYTTDFFPCIFGYL